LVVDLMLDLTLPFTLPFTDFSTAFYCLVRVGSSAYTLSPTTLVGIYQIKIAP
jgi:hypothetical protein